MNIPKQDNESAVRYTRLFEAAQDGILLLDYPSGIVHDANPYICKMLGYAREELVGKEMWQLGFIADKQAAKEVHDKLIRDGLVRYDDLSLQTKGGKIFESEFICNNYDLGEESGRQVIQCNIRDISDRRKAERELIKANVLKAKLMAQTVNSLANVIESRDPFTAGHQRRVAHLSVAIAREMGMNEDFIEGLHLACTIHDIGKMSVPAEVLTKPVALNELEKEMLRGHVQAGYDIIKDVEFQFPVAEAVLHHHERLDGSGYPQGLKGDEISLGGRIMAVADTVEAMSSNRPYRPGYGIDSALAEVENGRGTLYDAKAVDACLKLFRQDGYKLPEVPMLKYTSLSSKTA